MIPRRVHDSALSCFEGPAPRGGARPKYARAVLQARVVLPASLLTAVALGSCAGSALRAHGMGRPSSPSPLPTSRLQAAGRELPAAHRSSPPQRVDRPQGAPGARTSAEPDGGRPGIPVVHLRDFVRVLDVPVARLALGKNHVAALGEEPWVLRQGRWTQVPLPARFRSQGRLGEHLEIFFGRDDRPRLMGYRVEQSETSETASARTALYLRLKPSGWDTEWSELGQLGASRAGALYGVLGHADPEVVCREGHTCIVKRQSGWTTIPAPGGAALVRLCGDGVWGAFPDGVARLTSDGWSLLPVPTPVERPTSLCGMDDGSVWLTDQAGLYRFDGTAWAVVRSPLDSPAELWGTGPKDLWVVGAQGAAHFDGVEWRRVAGAPGPLACIAGTTPSGDVWLGGATGVWHGRVSGPH